MASSSSGDGMASTPREPRYSVGEYLRLPETLRPTELVYGVVREPPAPRYGHQAVVTRLTTLLDTHVRERDLGVVCVSPVDVVFDAYAALVLQPDIVFVTKERRGIIRDRIWGAPDLVVEVLSRTTEHRDRTLKLHWYRLYGVRECWLVDADALTLDVIALTDVTPQDTFEGEMVARSTVLPTWDVPTAAVFR